MPEAQGVRLMNNYGYAQSQDFAVGRYIIEFKTELTHKERAMFDKLLHKFMLWRIQEND